ncbi:MAG TPA: hypothetical protein VLD55_03000 [Candidatus Sulfobium mesophilum]|nr:hypothetical protein [Candidatus Sulfobium mesophilum]
MFKKNKDISAKTVNLLTVLTLVLTAFFVVYLSTTASAQFSLTGRVSAIDTHQKTITVTAYNGPDKPLGPDYGLALDRQARIMSGDGEKSFGDIREGDWVTITYHEESGGSLIAEGIAMTFPPASYSAYTGPRTFSLQGKVVVIDRDARTFTVDPSYYYGQNYSGGVRVFAYRDGAVVLLGSERRDFRDLRVGDWVTVAFHQEGNGFVVTDEIAITSPPAFYPESSARTISLQGKIVAIDRDVRTFTVDPSYYYGQNYSGGVRVFAYRDGAVVLLGSERRDFRDLRVGDWVTVAFHQEGNGFVVTDEIAITSPPVFYPESSARMITLPGKIVAIDSGARTLTIDPSYCYEPNFGRTRGVRVFALGSGVSVMMGNERRDFRDLRVGDWVTVSFHHEGNGIMITDGVALRSPATIGCTEKQG